MGTRKKVSCPRCLSVEMERSSVVCQLCAREMRAGAPEQDHRGHLTRDALKALLAAERGPESPPPREGVELAFPTPDPAYAPVYKPKGLVHGFFDIETSGGFNASFGRVLCAAMWIEGEAAPRRFDAFLYDDEPACLQAMQDAFALIDILVTFNGRRFDFRFINGRCVARNVPLFNRIKHLDLYSYARNFRTYNARLATLCEHFQLKEQKTHVPPEDWNRAVGGKRDAYDRIAEYNVRDVTVLPEVLGVCKPMILSVTTPAY